MFSLHPLLQVYDMMHRDERYYPSFKQSPLYVRMLAELDMLKEPSYRGSDDGDGESFNGSPTGSINLVRYLRFICHTSDLLNASPLPTVYFISFFYIYCQKHCNHTIIFVISVFGRLVQLLPWWNYAPTCLHLRHRYTSVQANVCSKRQVE